MMGISNNDSIILTENEWQILQAIRAMQPRDMLTILKKNLKADTEFEVRFQQVSFFFKGENDIERSGGLDTSS